MKNLHRSLVIGCSALALAGCGADEIVSPGTGGNVTINNPAPSPAPAPAPTPTPTSTLVTPASGCPTISNPTQLVDNGTIAGPTGTYRRCTLPTQFTVSTTLPFQQGLLYELNGQTDVGTDQGFATTNNDVTLTIEPGVIVFASGADFLNVNRGNRLNAVGTATSPIIFTSRDNVQGLVNENSSGQWGGVILSGRAPVASGCAVGGPNGDTCERRVEGATNQVLYGGSVPADNSGTLSFVQIRFSGFLLSTDNELQSLTTGGAGSGTTLNNIMSYNSSDDGIEYFGGRVNTRRLIVVGAEDDSLDTDNGVKAQFDEVLVVQRASASDRGIEQDSNGNEADTPRTNVAINNATFVSNSASNGSVFLIRGTSDFTLTNSLVWDQKGSVPCIQVATVGTINNPADAATDEAGPPAFNSVALDCATDFSGDRGVTAAQVEANFNGGAGNNASFTNTLTRLTGVTSGAPFINGTNENTYSPIFAVSSFFTARTYIGAVTSEAANWAEGWTCNSATVTLGLNNTGSCLTLPTT